jgi:mono/diheme cytochrome c family protein
MIENNIKFTLLSFAVCLAAVLFIDSCSVRRSIPTDGPLPLTDSSVVQGRIHFMAHCHKCHPSGNSGLGGSINKVPFTFLKRFQARHGLGVMPSFTEREISDEELDQILAYLQALRTHNNPEGGW